MGFLRQSSVVRSGLLIEILSLTLILLWTLIQFPMTKYMIIHISAFCILTIVLMKDLTWQAANNTIQESIKILLMEMNITYALRLKILSSHKLVHKHQLSIKKRPTHLFYIKLLQAEYRQTKFFIHKTTI